ncbi:MAG: hypothetical protein ABIU54_07320 [Candidatus Eisenbacteria bacterium]
MSRRLRPVAAPRPSILPVWASLCFFLSGAAGLLYELVWCKQLSYLLGSSLHSVATVVAAFLAGLALGARFLGVPLSRGEHGARTYALLELGVGALGLFLLPILRSLDPVVDSLYQNLGGESVGFAMARIGLLAGLLLPPAALMGATLPVLVARIEGSLHDSTLAHLYAINTFGAVAGSVAGGFLLMPALGLQATSQAAATLNLFAALIAWRLGGRFARPGAVPRPSPKARTLLTPGERGVFVLLFALSGFAALTFQISWVRLFALVLGSSVYSFSGVLGLYLFGLALGSALAAPGLGRGVTLAGFAQVQLGIAASAALGLVLFPHLPQQMLDLARAAGADWGQLAVMQLGLVAEVLLMPCILMGALFPMAARLLQRGDGGHAAGFAYAVNTAGTIVGSLAAGFLLLPNLGVQGTHQLAITLTAFLALGAAAMAYRRRELTPRARILIATMLASTAAFTLLAPRWDPVLMSAGTYRPFHANNLETSFRLAGGVGEPVRTVSRAQRVLYYRDGINASVLVSTDEDSRRRWMRVGGKIDASTGDMTTQVLLGLLPAALADSGARTLVVGHGSGFTAAGALAAGAGPTDIVELERGVIEGSRFFHEPGQDPLDDPRVTLHMDDARTLLAHGKGRYGLIISEPSNPWIAGVNNLFTVDFYQRVRARLEPDGVFCQWIQLYELSPQTFGSLVGSFLKVFPDAQMFCVWRGADLLVIAAPPQRSLSLQRLSTPASRRQLQRTAIGGGPFSPEALAAFYSTPLRYLTPLTQGVPLNRDDRPYVEYRAPRDMVTIGRGRNSQDPRVVQSIPFFSSRPVLPLFAEWPPAQWYRWRGREQIDIGDPAQIPAVIQQVRDAGLPDVAEELERLAQAKVERGAPR